jgi:hypothetical protein
MITSTEVLHKLSSEPFWETSNHLLNTKPIVPHILETTVVCRKGGRLEHLLAASSEELGD